MSDSETGYQTVTQCPLCGSDPAQDQPMYDERVDEEVYGCAETSGRHTYTTSGLVWSTRMREFVPVEQFDRRREKLASMKFRAKMAVGGPKFSAKEES